MKKWILLIGLLTHSSLGWSETLMMECRGTNDWIIYKLDTDKPNDSEHLLMDRVDGKWLGTGCSNRTRSIKKDVICQKGDGSVVMEWTNNITKKRTKSVWDFRFPSYKVTSYFDDGGIRHRSSEKCRKK